MSRPVAAVVAAVLAALTLATLATGATAATPKTTVNEVEAEVMCVTCNVPLSIAESPAADAQRRSIKRLVDQGLTKDEVKDRLVGIYGKRVLAKPDDSGLGLAAYLVPIGLVLAALAALAVIVPRWRRRRDRSDDDDTPDAQAPELSAADADRLEKDLARYGV